MVSHRGEASARGRRGTITNADGGRRAVLPSSSRGQGRGRGGRGLDATREPLQPMIATATGQIVSRGGGGCFKCGECQSNCCHMSSAGPHTSCMPYNFSYRRASVALVVGAFVGILPFSTNSLILHAPVCRRAGTLGQQLSDQRVTMKVPATSDWCATPMKILQHETTNRKCPQIYVPDRELHISIANNLFD